MQRIVILGDVHDHQDRLASTLEMLAGMPFDLVLLVGDIGADPPWSSPARELLRANHDASVKRGMDVVRAALCCPLVFVPGNHDLPAPPTDVRGTNTDRRIVGVAGLQIAGFGGAGPQHFGFPYEWTEAEAEAALGELLLMLEKKVDIFLFHAPPLNSSLDRVRCGEHVGSSAIARWIARVRPRLFVCGHIHEAWGVEWLNGVPCLNAGSLGEPYGQEIVWVVDWEEDGPARIESWQKDAVGRVARRLWAHER